MVDFPRKSHFGTWQFYAFGILTVVVFSGLISACQKTDGKSSVNSISFSTQTISETQKSLPSVTITSFPTPSPIPSNTPQPTWTPTVQIPVSLNTPFPFSLSTITANNIKDLQQIAKFNFRQLENVYYSEKNNNALIEIGKQLVSIDLDTGSTTDIALNFKGTTIPSPDFSRLITFDTLTQVILMQKNGELVSKIEISDKSHRFYVARNQAFSPDSKYLTTVEEWGDPSNQYGAYYLYVFTMHTQGIFCSRRIHSKNLFLVLLRGFIVTLQTA